MIKQIAFVFFTVLALNSALARDVDLRIEITVPRIISLASHDMNPQLLENEVTLLCNFPARLLIQASQKIDVHPDCLQAEKSITVQAPIHQSFFICGDETKDVTIKVAEVL